MRARPFNTRQHPNSVLERGKTSTKSDIKSVLRLYTYSVVAATAPRLTRTRGFRERILDNGR